MDFISDRITKPLYKKVDRGMNLVITNPYTGDLYLCGEDKFLKKYDFPSDHFTKIDLKKPPNPPIEELDSHNMATTCYDISNECKFLVTGGRDGNFCLRNMNYVQ